MGRHKVRHRSGTAPFFCGERADLGRHRLWEIPIAPTLRIGKIKEDKKAPKNHVGGYFVKNAIFECSRHLEKVVPNAIFRVFGKLVILGSGKVRKNHVPLFMVFEPPFQWLRHLEKVAPGAIFPTVEKWRLPNA